MIFISCVGVLRRLFVWPSEMVWPWNLPYLVTIRTLHEVESPFTAKWLGLTRRRFFVILLIITFCYPWVSRFMFTMLGVFPWWCLINQNSIVLSQLTGPRAFSIGLLPLDWSVISNVLRTPIIVPAWGSYQYCHQFHSNRLGAHSSAILYECRRLGSSSSDRHNKLSGYW